MCFSFIIIDIEFFYEASFDKIEIIVKRAFHKN